MVFGLLASAAMPEPLRGQGADSPQPMLPNVILCMSDDQGWGDTGYNGHAVLRTPHLDQMAAEGIRFQRFYAAAPVCSPTRGSCLTGRHPARYGIPFANTGHLLPGEVTLAEVLKTRGYTTGHFGKWHLGTLTTRIKDSNRGRPGDDKHYAPPWVNGFDECFSTEAKVPTYWQGDRYSTYGTSYWTGPNQRVPPEAIDVIRGDDSKLIMDRAIRFIEGAANSETSFLAVIWFHTPHLPVVSAPPYTDGYDKNQDYYGCLAAMDQQMGRLRSELKRLAIENNTMLWFCSDNGPEGNDSAPGRTNGLRGRKRSLYEGGVRVPGLLVWPKMIRDARVVTMPCSTSDYFPTVLDVLDEPMPGSSDRSYDGISLLPLIRGVMERRTEPIGFQSRSQTALIDNRYKIYRRRSADPYQLYDLLADPGEQRDIAGEHPEIVARMQQTLKQWQQSCLASQRRQAN